MRTSATASSAAARSRDRGPSMRRHSRPASSHSRSSRMRLTFQIALDCFLLLRALPSEGDLALDPAEAEDQANVLGNSVLRLPVAYPCPWDFPTSRPRHPWPSFPQPRVWTPQAEVEIPTLETNIPLASATFAPGSLVTRTKRVRLDWRRCFGCVGPCLRRSSSPSLSPEGR